MNPIRKLLRAGLLAAILIVLAAGPGSVASAQDSDITDVVTIDVDAGYNGFFRAHQWLPLRITVTNNGDAVAGQLVVRPETSGNTLTNAFSTPVNIQPGTSQVIFLYITARSGGTLRAELLDDEGRVAADEDFRLTAVNSTDRLYVVISGTAAGSVINLMPVTTGGFNAIQSEWGLFNIPDRSAALDAVDALVINDVNTSDLSGDQRRSLARWVEGGGHLIVTGGADWQTTASGLEDLLPLEPDNSETINDIDALLRFGGDPDTSYNQSLTAATGDLVDGGRVLAGDDIPLVMRREFGAGTVDYIAVSPNAQPIRTWNGLSGLWLSLLSSVDAQPSWTHGFANWSRAEDAVELQGELLSVFSLIAFLAAYVGLVGPVNYLVLNRLNKRELAWVTIPVLIIAFTVIARAIGFNLRGSEIQLSRLSVVQSWPGMEEARVDQLIGLLAPRRAEYALGVADERLMRPIPRGSNTGVLGAATQFSATIRQTATFEAIDFQVDDGFVAGFTTTGHIPTPAISGSVTLVYPDDLEAEQVLQGSVRNDSDLTLLDPVLLARGEAFSLGDALGPGAVRSFSGSDVRLSGTSVPAPSPLEYASGETRSLTLASQRSRSAFAEAQSASARDILGREIYDLAGAFFDSDDPTDEMNRRRRAFLDSFVLDQFASTSRGDRVFLAAWSEQAPLDEEVRGADWSPNDLTLYLVELDVTVDAPENDPVRIRRDQFTWLSQERVDAVEAGPADLVLFSESAVTFRFTPVPGAVLADVDTLVVVVERSSGTRNLQAAVEVWDWDRQAWFEVEITPDGEAVLQNPRRYIGPQNAVQVRVHRPELGGTLTIDLLAIEQIGTF